MRASATHDGKDLGQEIAALRAQLDELANSVNGSRHSRGVEALEDALRSARDLIAKYGGDAAGSVAHGTARLKDKASTTLIEQTESRPFTTLMAILGIGFAAGLLCRRY